MLEIRCSESEAVMRMRGMPSICIAAQRVCAAGGANIRLVESFFATPAKKLRQLSTISMARRVIKNYGVDSNCHQSTDAIAVNLPTQVQGRSPGKSQRLRTCGYIYDGGTSSRLLRDFSSHSTFHGKPSPRLDRLGVRWLSGSEPFTETHRRHCVTVSCRNNVKV